MAVNRISMRMYIHSILILAGLSLGLIYPAAAQTVTLSGTVREAGGGELLAGAVVQVAGTTNGSVTNAYGFYALNVPANQPVEIVARQMGYSAFRQTLTVRADLLLDITLRADGIQLDEVAVRAEADPAESEVGRMSINTLSMRQLRAMPMLMGEKDIMKALQLMPGVQKGREGMTGLYVRGGGPDQNLLILDDAVVYNANHLFGFFSVFNGDALRRVELIKGGFPARYGGRLSSVVDMQMKEGNRQKLHGAGGIGLLAGRMTLEGPIRRGKSSFLVSGRRSFADWILRPLSGGEFPKVYFYDLNVKASTDLGSKDRLFISSYLGRDAFAFVDNTPGSAREDGFNWGNLTASARWNHQYSPRLFSNTTLVFSQYNFTVFNQQTVRDATYSLRYSSGIRDFSAKMDFDYRPGQHHTLTFGGIVTSHRYTPNAVVRKGTLSGAEGTPPTDAIETGLYIEDNWQPTAGLTLVGGLRYSGFAVNGRPYHNLEPRLTTGYQLARQWSLKASYARMNQYVQLLSNSGLGLPTDLWVPATERIPPQRADQVAVGLVKDLPKANLTLTVEAFHKTMNQLIGYREGASFLLLDFGPDAQRTSAVDWQENVTIGRGRADGLEVLAQRKAGRLSGWAGYTLSWIRHRFPDVNEGREFYPRYDRRHDVSVVGIYQWRPRITLSATFVYGTGNNLTIPVAKSNLLEHSFTGFNGAVPVNQYGATNSFRAAAYHRLDLSVQFKKSKRWGERQWEVSVYNAYNRVNPFYYEIRSSTSPDGAGKTTSKLYRKGLFPLIPSVNYSFTF